MKTVMLVFVGGGFGSLARYGVSRLMHMHFQSSPPVATLISNLLATAILALILFGTFSKGNMGISTKVLLTVGFCGGFSTFSTFSLETFELIRNGNLSFAIINVVLSILLALAVIFLISKSL